VTEQSGQSIPGGPFVAPGVRERIYDHVFSSLEAEVGGVLIGHLREDGSPLVIDIIAALEAEGGRSRVTFTHEAWSVIHSTLDQSFPGEEILGWYHSHPGFGIFLSEHDLFIHRNFFGRPEQIAIVVDPHAGSEGLFVWRAGEVVKAAEEPTLRPGERPEQVERALSDEKPGPSRGALAFYWVLGMVFGVLVWLAFINDGGSSGANGRRAVHSQNEVPAKAAAAPRLAPRTKARPKTVEP
jgi:proteasome lid subunit RPN8/RPN11